MRIKVKEAKTVWQQTKGLLGTTKPYPLLLKTRWGIHTFAMRYPIDIVILDRSNTIVKMKEDLNPNQIFFWNPKYSLILELPKGYIKTYKLKIGQTLPVEIIL